MLQESENPLEVESVRIISEKHLFLIKKKQKYHIRRTTTRLEKKAYLEFYDEFEDYLDILLTTESMFQRNKQHIFNGENHENMNSIKVDKLMLELIESPEKLWGLLSSRIKNVWLEKTFVRLQFFSFLR